jgi:hypothetical protein
MLESEVTNWDYPDETPQYSPKHFRDMVDAYWKRIDEEKELAKTHDYRQVWLMSEKQWDSLPNNPNWKDMMEAGGQFLGYQWVEK